MALTTYSYISGVSAAGLTSAVDKSGLAPVGKPVQRGTVLIQFLGTGTADVGTVTGYQVVAGATPDELVTNVQAVLAADVQPVGEPVARGTALFQVMGKITAESSGTSYTLPAATGDSLGGVSIGANIGITAAGEISVGVGSATTVGLVKGGSNVAFASDGTISVSNANTAAAGAVKQATNVAAVAADADAAALATALNAVIAAQIAAGQMASGS